MKPNPLPFLLERWRGVPKPTMSFAGKTIIVTGSNTGIGFQAALCYAELGASLVILGVRDTLKGESAKQEIEALASAAKVEVWELDMSNYESIENFAMRVDELPQLDVVVLNAGVICSEFIIGCEGWETTLQVNVLSTALLGLLMMKKLQQNRGSHLLIVTSEAHRWLESTDFPDKTKPLAAANINAGSWDPLLQNAKSKLFAFYVSQVLASMSNLKVVVTPICPGACKSNLMRDLKMAGLGQKVTLGAFDSLFNKPVIQGGWSYVWASTLDDTANGLWYKTTQLTTPGTMVTTDEGMNMKAVVWCEITKTLSNRTLKVRDLLENYVLREDASIEGARI